MRSAAPDRNASPPVRGAPLLVTAELPPDVFAWADALRRRHYPADRLRLGAHITLFHALPPSAEGAVRRVLAEAARQAPPRADISGLMDLDRGTAIAVDSPATMALHADLAERLHGVIQQRDTLPLRLHITVQNKVTVAEARALQAELRDRLPLRSFHLRGLGLYVWREELWQQAHVFGFRGRD